MSNRKAHRREHSFRRSEKFERRMETLDGHARQIEHRQTRRSAWQVIMQWLTEPSEVLS